MREKNVPPKNTPWGRWDIATEWAEGVWFVSTPSHGGVWLSPEKRKKIKAKSLDDLNALRHPAAQAFYHQGKINFLNSPTWWEEDCDAIVPMRFFGIMNERGNMMVKPLRELDA